MTKVYTVCQFPARGPLPNAPKRDGYEDMETENENLRPRQMKLYTMKRSGYFLRSRSKSRGRLSQDM